MASSGAWKASERRIAGKLAEWLTGNKDAFKRAPVSGGWPKKRSHGDIIANDDVRMPDNVIAMAKAFTSTWSVDVKRRVGGSSGEWHFEQLLTAKKHPIIAWFDEITALANTRGTYRMLIINKAKRYYYVVLGAREMIYLEGCLARHIGGYLPPDALARIFGTRVTLGRASGETLTFFELGSFLKLMPSRIFGGVGDAPDTLANRAFDRLRKASVEDTAKG